MKNYLDICIGKKLQTIGRIIFLYETQEGKCFYCKNSLFKEVIDNHPPHIDHKIPKSRGGSSKMKNLCLACYFCNCSKNNKTEAEFLEFRKNNHRQKSN